MLNVFGAVPVRNDRPLIVYFHGGVFNCGAPEDAEPLAKALSDTAVVVCVAYPLAPGCRFPDTVEIAFEALKWAAAHAKDFGADRARIFVAGDQAGGNLAAATALVARDRRALAHDLPPLAGQVLLTPLLDPVQASKSMQTVADAPCRKGWAAYLPCLSDALHPYAAPVHSRRLGSLPPALILTAERDPLRDEAETYAAKLIGAGVQVRVHRVANAAGDLVNPAHPEFATVVAAVGRFVSDAN
ncbi:MAG TPA: alpha/beta hydrolase [Noviherbaspirillum sp.]|nr:alpha/beta hydrolase [Noviherbaspirillum sp.]